MNYEEKIIELTERIEQLEKKEKQRMLKKKIKITWTIIKLLTIIILLIIIYNSIYKPYQNKINYIEEKIKSVETFTQEKWNIIKKYIPIIKY